MREDKTCYLDRKHAGDGKKDDGVSHHEVAVGRRWELLGRVGEEEEGEKEKEEVDPRYKGFKDCVDKAGC